MGMGGSVSGWVCWWVALQVGGSVSGWVWVVHLMGGCVSVGGG